MTKALTNKLVTHLTQEVISPYSTRLFTFLVYLWFLFNVIFVWDVKDLLWGVNNVFYRQGHSDGLIENFFFQLIYDATRFKIIFYAHIISTCMSLIERSWSFIPRLISWATAWMLYYSAIEAFNSGMLIMIAMSLYAAFMCYRSTNPYRMLFTNLARYAALTQVMLVYFTATIYKLSGEQWLSGDAVYYAMHIDHFSSDWWIHGQFVQRAFIMKGLNYFALLYQLVFPVMIWVNKGRNTFLFFGILFHLFIGIFMHLWDFSLAMIFVYALFISDKNIRRMMTTFLAEKRIN
jgi:hypothetical protein